MSETEKEFAPERPKPPQWLRTRSSSQLQPSESSDSEDEYIGLQREPIVHTETLTKVDDKNRDLEPPTASSEQAEPETSNNPLPLPADDSQMIPKEGTEIDPDPDLIGSGQESGDVGEPSGEDIPDNTDTDNTQVLELGDTDNDHSNTNIHDK